MPGGITYKKLEALSFTEAQLNLRTTTKTWGSAYLFASGGLQHDITMAAEKFDQWQRDGIVPDSSGVAVYGSATLPLKSVFVKELVAGGPDISGKLFIYGGIDTQSGTGNQLYELVVDSGAVQAWPVGSVSTPSS